MKAVFIYVWQRRWCRALLWAALLFGFACLHPFVRQSIFGPKIGGIAWCVWEDRVRTTANMGQPKPWLYQMLEKIGLLQPDGAWDFGSKEASPLYLHLAEDPDPRVRIFAMRHLRHVDDAVIIDLAKRHLTDAEPGIRMGAAHIVWRASKDKELRHIVVPLLDHADYEVRTGAICTLGEMSRYARKL